MPHHYYRDEYDCEVLLDQVVPVGIVVVGNRRDRQVVQLEINPEHGEGQKRTAEGNEIQKKNRSPSKQVPLHFSQKRSLTLYCQRRRISWDRKSQFIRVCRRVHSKEDLSPSQ